VDVHEDVAFDPRIGAIEIENVVISAVEEIIDEWMSGPGDCPPLKSTRHCKSEVLMHFPKKKAGVGGGFSVMSRNDSPRAPDLMPRVPWTPANAAVAVGKTYSC
jgi:hypothetical protein